MSVVEAYKALLVEGGPGSRAQGALLVEEGEGDAGVGGSGGGDDDDDDDDDERRRQRAIRSVPWHEPPALGGDR